MELLAYFHHEHKKQHAGDQKVSYNNIEKKRKGGELMTMCPFGGATYDESEYILLVHVAVDGRCSKRSDIKKENKGWMKK